MADLKIDINNAILKNKFYNSSLSQDLGLSFTDIDLWFLSDNEIYDINSKEHILISDFERDLPESNNQLGLTFGKALKRKYNENHKTFDKANADNIGFLNKFGLSKIESSTQWANSYHKEKYDHNKIPIQFIKKPYKTVEQIFSNFDLVNCAAAYHAGYFYFHKEFEKAFDLAEITLLSDFEQVSTIRKFWSASRFFKYAHRYNFEFSEEICNALIPVYIDGLRISDDIKAGRDPELNLTDVNDLELPYGISGMDSLSKIQRMIEALNTQFSSFTKMKNFDKNKLFLFLDSKELSIKDVVKAHLDVDEKQKKTIWEV